MASYQGHRSWNAWNVALWIGNDEGLYRFALDCLKRGKGSMTRATSIFMREVGNSRTPDGGVFNRTSVKEALQGLVD